MDTRLFELAAALARGDTQADLYEEIAGHVQGCVGCQVELDDILDMIEPVYAAGLAPAPAYPAPNLRFLRPAAAPARPWLVEAGRLIVLFSEELLASLRPPALAGAARGLLLYRYTQEPGSVADMDVAIEVYADDPSSRQGRVRVHVDIPSRGPLDQTGSLVVLRAGDLHMRGATDESGTADFAPVPLSELPQLRIEITPS